MTVAHRIAEQVAGSRPEALEPAALAAARAAVMDTFAVTLLGSREPCARILRALPGAVAPGPCTVLGSPEATAPLEAALLNGTASHALDYDDFNEAFGGHPSVPVLGALVPLAELRGEPGRRLLEAFVIGVEVETRLAGVVHFHHYEKGWHPTSTLGVFGGAAACAWLLGLAPERTAAALGVAASLASGLKANFGTMTKPLHVGHCARSALLAALLAERGFTASADALEHPQGFLEVFNGAGTYDLSRLDGAWLDPPAVLEPGISVKQFPCCGSTHPAIFMALELRERHRFAPHDIEGVEIRTHPRRLPHTDHPDPRSPLEAKFSLQYCVARALVDGVPRLEHFEGEAYADPRVRRVLAVTRAGPDPEMAARTERTFGAEVTVVLRGGARHVARVEHRPGRGPDDPMSGAELEAKFTDCASRALPAERVRALREALGALETLPDVRAVTRLARADPAPGTAAPGTAAAE